jgi:Peptidase family M28
MNITSLHATLAALALSAACASPIRAQETPDPLLLRASVEKLVRFGTRHTLSSQTDPKRGIGAARKWAADEFRKISKSCKNCIQVESVERVFTGDRAPEGGVNVADILAIQPGRMGFDHVIIIAGHIDSRVTGPMDFTSDAPGANDDGSGSALVLEAARIMSAAQYDATIVYALLSGEEQGLWGGTLLAETAKKRGWKVTAMLNNDIVGGTVGTDGRTVSGTVRIFSEGIRSSENLEAQMARRGSGGEDDGPSRALMRYAKKTASDTPKIGLEAFGVRRPDRFRRGGDHLPSLEFGYPAIRFTVGVENYDQQHQDLRAENGIEYGDTADKMDFPYLSKVTELNITVARSLANAPPAPAEATLDGAVSSDTIVNWTPVTGASAYHIYVRRADAQDWGTVIVKSAKDLALINGKLSATLKGIIVDDHFIGVSAVGAQSTESIVTFAGLPQRSR